MMNECNASKMSSLLLLATTLLLCMSEIRGQGCRDTCPPLNDIGVPVPSMCPGDETPPSDASRVFRTCPAPGAEFRLSDFAGPGRVTVVANYYFGCNAGRRESGVFAHVAQRLYDAHGGRVAFVASNKGASCDSWSWLMRNDATEWYPGSKEPVDMPLVMDDADNAIRDRFFTTPFGHPSYVVLDGSLRMRHKFVGPCCGYESFYSCKLNVAKRLDDTLTGMVESLLAESAVTDAPTAAAAPTTAPAAEECAVGAWSAWSGCASACGGPGSSVEFRHRTVEDSRAPTGDLPPCPSDVERRPCAPPIPCPTDECVSEMGPVDFELKKVAEGFSGATDVKFHPKPGTHLGRYSEGRPFPKSSGKNDEAWVLNGGNHSVSIVVNADSNQPTTLSRRDRGYYHYMINATAFSFNTVGDSGRDPDRDSFGYWSVCNDDTNTYLGTKEPNYFMGPTLYDSRPDRGNLVNRLGEPCDGSEQCFFMHSDMLHEAPACVGIAHDPETATAYGNVYWAFDATGDRTDGQLVRFDFQQPHGPGSMDHAVAGVRRYVEVRLTRGGKGVHAGMAVHPERREVYIAVPGADKVIVVGADSGEYARIAREEYPIYSNRLPSFDYSIYECVEQRVFADGIDTPTGLALSRNGRRLFVAERGTGKIHAYDVDSGTKIHSIKTGLKGIGGMAVSPSGALYFVDRDTDALYSHPGGFCPRSRRAKPRYNPSFMASLADAKQANPLFSLYRDASCVADTRVPNTTYFEQVHADSGYAGENSTMGGVDTAALANRTDCGPTSDLNFDALLLGGYYCHPCLPDGDGAMCDDGGRCSNVQWRGYTCDNHFFAHPKTARLYDPTGEKGPQVRVLDPDVTYRFTTLPTNGNRGKHAARLYLSEHKTKPIETDLYPSASSVSAGEMLLRPSDLDACEAPRTLYLRTTRRNSQRATLHIDFPCEDVCELKLNGNKNRDCAWVARQNARAKKKLCREGLPAYRKCPVACAVGLCGSSGGTKSRLR